MHLKLPNPLYEEESLGTKEVFSPKEFTAIHSGKLGDIIYALPICRSMGITHLYLNLYLEKEDPLRYFSLEAAKSIVPLLLAQTYIRKVSIVHLPHSLESCKKIEGIDFILDHFRRVAWQRISKSYLNLESSYLRLRRGPFPAHLVEHFESLYGIEVDLGEKWLEVPEASSKIPLVISITNNWRSFSNEFWREVLKGFPKAVFVGHPAEFEKARIPNAYFMPTQNALELAQVIAQAQFFMGTVSFPYAIAEGLKVHRMVEPCLKNLNVFPVNLGHVLPSSIYESRKILSGIFSSFTPARLSLKSFYLSLLNQIQLSLTPINTTRTKFLKSFLARALQTR